jgi:hypothetical protein
MGKCDAAQYPWMAGHCCRTCFGCDPLCGAPAPPANASARNITVAMANDRGAAVQGELTVSLYPWSSGSTPAAGQSSVFKPLRTWAVGSSSSRGGSSSSSSSSSRGGSGVGGVRATCPAFSSVNLTTIAWDTALDGHNASDVFLVAEMKMAEIAGTGTGTGTGSGGGGGSTDSLLQGTYFFTKIKAAALVDPEITVTFASATPSRVSSSAGASSVSSSAGASATAAAPPLTVTVSSKQPAPFVFVDPGMLLGHFDDNGFLLLPGQPRVLTFIPGGSEAEAAASVSMEDLKREVQVRTPWHVEHGKKLRII